MAKNAEFLGYDVFILCLSFTKSLLALNYKQYIKSLQNKFLKQAFHMPI